MMIEFSKPRLSCNSIKIEFYEPSLSCNPKKY